MKKVLKIIGLTLLMLAMAACGNVSSGSTGEGDKVVFTERQIEILKYQELPADYELLTDTQKNAIEKIEKMLSYLEDKYEREFLYEGFWPKTKSEPEHMQAVMKDYYEDKKVMVYGEEVDGNYIMSDNFINILVEPYYEEVIFNYVNDFFDREEIKVIADKLETDESVTEEDVLKKTSGVMFIFINGDRYTKENLDIFIDKYGEWLNSENENKHNVLTKFKLVKPDEFDGINKANLNRKSLEDIYIYEKKCQIIPGIGISNY